MKDALTGVARPPVQKSHVTQGLHRLTMYDVTTGNEPMTAWSKANDVFTRYPGLSKERYKNAVELFHSYALPDSDLMVCSDAGSTKVAKHIRDGFTTTFGRSSRIVNHQLLAAEKDLEARRLHHLTRRNAKRLKSYALSEFSRTTGHEKLMIMSYWLRTAHAKYPQSLIVSIHRATCCLLRWLLVVLFFVVVCKVISLHVWFALLMLQM